MNWYKEYYSKWKEIIETVARELGRSEQMVEKCIVGSFVGKFCRESEISLPVPFEAAEVLMNVQSIERTFVDKVFAVCDYKIQNMQDRDSRHLYDICKLLGQVNLDKELSELVAEVRDDRMKSKNNLSAQPEYNIPEMLQDIIGSRFYEADYKNVTQKLLYENISYDYAVEQGIAIVAKSKVFEYRKPSLNTKIKSAGLRKGATNRKQGTATDEERLIDDDGERKGPHSRPIDVMR